MNLSSPPSAAAAGLAGVGATLAAAGTAGGAALGFSTGAGAGAGAGAAWILSTTACSGSAGGGAFGGSLAKSLAASRTASLLPYIGLFGSAACPAVGSATLLVRPLSVNGVEPLLITRATTTAIARPMTRPMTMPMMVLPCWRERGVGRGLVRKFIVRDVLRNYILLGAETPISARPLRSTWRVATISAIRAALSASSSTSTRSAK